jgi:hypothetical protein
VALALTIAGARPGSLALAAVSWPAVQSARPHQPLKANLPGWQLSKRPAQLAESCQLAKAFLRQRRSWYPAISGAGAGGGWRTGAQQPALAKPAALAKQQQLSSGCSKQQRWRNVEMAKIMWRKWRLRMKMASISVK